MATAIEYGLVAALIAVAGITGMTSLGHHLSNPPVARNASCVVDDYAMTPGVAKLDCGSYATPYNRFVEDDDIILENVARPGGVLLTCDLHKSREPDCKINKDPDPA